MSTNLPPINVYSHNVGYHRAIVDARERLTTCVEVLDDKIEIAREGDDSWYADILANQREGVEIALRHLDDLERLNG